MRRAGFILTGGSSSRMGRDKALLPWRNSTIVEHLAHLLQPVTGTVTLVGEPERYRHLAIPCIPDLRPRAGPAGGIEAALASSDAACLVLACDIPGVPSDWFIELFRSAEQGDALFTGIRDATGALHPLCAVYRRESLPIIQRALDSGERRLLRVVDQLNPVWLDAEDVLSNVNTSEEWRAACSR